MQQAKAAVMGLASEHEHGYRLDGYRGPARVILPV